MEMPAVIDQIKNPKEWTKGDTLRQVLSSGLILADLGQTHNINKKNGLSEKNPILGKHPSRERLNEMVGLALLANLLVPRMLPPKYRRLMQNVVIGREMKSVSGNHKIGMKVEF